MIAGEAVQFVRFCAVYVCGMICKTVCKRSRFGLRGVVLIVQGIYHPGQLIGDHLHMMQLLAGKLHE